MLVLGRKERESLEIRVGKEVIVVSVERVDGKRVRLGVEASPVVHIVRSEINDKENGDGV